MEAEKKRDGLVTIIARFIKYNKIFMLFISILVMLLYMTVFGDKGLLSRIALEQDKKSLEEQLKNETGKTNELQNEIRDLNTSNEKIEKTAREKYGFTKEGEKIYKVKIDTLK